MKPSLLAVQTSRVRRQPAAQAQEKGMALRVDRIVLHGFGRVRADELRAWLADRWAGGFDVDASAQLRPRSMDRACFAHGLSAEAGCGEVGEAIESAVRAACVGRATGALRGGEEAAWGHFPVHRG
jgi:hypothetical protein